MSVDLPLGWMRAIIDAGGGSRRPMQPVVCIGHFFDNERKVRITVDLGFVSVRCPFSFRSESSQDENLNVLSWAEGSVQNDELPEHAARFFDAGYALSENGITGAAGGAAFEVLPYGFYVIPVQSLMDETKC